MLLVTEKEEAISHTTLSEAAKITIMEDFIYLCICWPRVTME